MGLYLEATETVVQRECAGNVPARCQSAWERVPDRLAFYDYLGHNPAKGGLFRTGPMVLGDGIVLGWLGHPTFNLADGTPVYPRRMPKYSLESVGLSVVLRGGALNGVRLDAPGTVAGLARTAQFGELLDFDRTSNLVDGVLRTSVRGWYTTGNYTCLTFLYEFFVSGSTKPLPRRVSTRSHSLRLGTFLTLSCLPGKPPMMGKSLEHMRV